MYLSTYNPNRNLAFHSLREFDSLFDRVFGDRLFSNARHFNMDETDDSYRFELELPGFKQGDLELTLDKSVLSVSAKRGDRSYQQSVTVPEDIDPEKVEAKLEDGLLSISLIKTPEAKPRRIAIK